MADNESLEVPTDNCARLKAAAWAWYEHGAGMSKRLCKSEAAASRRVSALRPSRFRTEAVLQLSRRVSLNSSAKASVSIDSDNSLGMTNEIRGWDCGSTLLDSFEIVSIAKQLDDGLTPSSVKTVKASPIQGDAGSPTRKTLQLINSQRRQLKNTKLHVPILIRPFCQSFRIVPPESGVDLSVHKRSQSVDCVWRAGEANYSKHGDAHYKHKNCNRSFRERTSHRLSHYRIWKALYYITHLPQLGCRDAGQQHHHHHHHHRHEQLHDDQHYHYHAHGNKKPRHPGFQEPDSLLTTAVSVQTSSLLPAYSS